MIPYSPLQAKRHTPPYKIHRYFARRPWNVFKQLIEIYSSPGDLVLDPFCGGGVSIYEGIKLDRRMIGYDLNPLAIFIVKNMIKKGESKELKEANRLVADLIKTLYEGYRTATFENDVYQIEWEVLAHRIKCPYCGNIIVLKNENKISNGFYSCSNNECIGSKHNHGKVKSIDGERIDYIYLYTVVKAEAKYKIIDIDEPRKRKILDHIKLLGKLCEERNITIPYDAIPLDWDRQKEDLLSKKNIKNFQDLFTQRNLYINLIVQKFIDDLKLNHSDKQILQMVFSSSLRDTNIMAFTNSSWQSGRPITWSFHAYWLPSEFVEVNVFDSWNRAYDRVKKSLIFNQGFPYSLASAESPHEIINDKTCNVLLINRPINFKDLPECSIDAIITDPPYGSNVQYLELSHFWYPWNKKHYDVNSIDFSKEAVANRKSNFRSSKDFYDYENNLYDVFGPCYQVLKMNKLMTLTFNNKDIRAWLAITIAIFRAGFNFVEDGLYYQSGVSSYKNTAHTRAEGSPYGDFIYIFRKSLEKGTSKVYDNQEKFISDIDFIFSDYLGKFHSNKNKELIRNMFCEVMPLINGFVSSFLNSNTHTIYDLFTKDYMDRI